MNPTNIVYLLPGFNRPFGTHLLLCVPGVKTPGYAQRSLRDPLRWCARIIGCRAVPVGAVRRSRRDVRPLSLEDLVRGCVACNSPAPARFDSAAYLQWQ